MGEFDRESMLEMFTFEMYQLLENLEQSIIQNESGYTMDGINEIFRIMHTIKGSAAMMMFENVSFAAHAIEDLFFYLREENPDSVDYSGITDLVLEILDFIKEEMGKIAEGLDSDGECPDTIARIKDFLADLKAKNGHAPIENETTQSSINSSNTDNNSQISSQSDESSSEKKNILDKNSFEAKIRFDDGCEMENIRAFTLVNNLKDIAVEIEHIPENIIDEKSIDYIRKNGFQFNFYSSKSYDEVEHFLKQTIYLRELELNQLQLGDLKNYEASLYFDEGAEMENVRAFTVKHNLRNVAQDIKTIPEDLIDDDSIYEIRQNGLKMFITSPKDYDEMLNLLSETLYLKDLILKEIKDETKKEEPKEGIEIKEIEEDIIQIQEEPIQQEVVPNQTPNTNSSISKKKTAAAQEIANSSKKPVGQHVISVNVSKLDDLLKLMGELVISEAMVTQNPELDDLELESFRKEARQLRKIIKDLQDTVMSMRMVPLSTTFFKMHRIVRDMCKQLGKNIELEIVGEETEVDKNITEHISDPLMHIIRNSADHGIETPEERKAKGKPEKGTILLEAKNSGSDVLIIVKDDGAGLNRDKILQKAINNNLLKKPESEYSDKEIFQFIFGAGFSTNENVTSYSGRGVGMDVVVKNLEMVGGTVSVDSIRNEGSTFTLKIPLTLAIVEGMMIKMGCSKYTIPIVSIKDSFKPNLEDVFMDPSGNEMIAVRGECYNVVRLYEFFGAETEITNLEDGIMIMVENGDDTICLFVDDIIGEQQVVVKSIPKYINRIRGISGCTLLGNGDISLIIDVAGFFDK